MKPNAEWEASRGKEILISLPLQSPSVHYPLLDTAHSVSGVLVGREEDSIWALETEMRVVDAKNFLVYVLNEREEP